MTEARERELLLELKTARDEMERQACLYAEASRHRAELCQAVRDFLEAFANLQRVFGKDK